MGADDFPESRAGISELGRGMPTVIGQEVGEMAPEHLGSGENQDLERMATVLDIEVAYPLDLWRRLLTENT